MSLGSAVRGCGKRILGGIYAETKMSADGRPIEDFLVDPPAKVDEQALGLSNVGVKLIQTNDVWNVLDIIGQDSYPNVADFVEEVRRFGLSRRLPKTLDFSKLTAASRIILLHRRAYIENFSDYPEWTCPKNRVLHDRFTHVTSECCAGLWWEDVAEAVVADEERIVRRMPSFSYDCHGRPAGVEPAYSLAIFATFPIHNLAVIHDPDGSDEEALQAAGKANLSVALEDE